MRLDIRSRSGHTAAEAAHAGGEVEVEALLERHARANPGATRRDVADGLAAMSVG